MPYKLSGNCVVRADNGQTVKCHGTHRQALAHLRALEVNVKDAKTKAQKAGARHSMSDQQHLQMAHDHLSAAGANCSAPDEAKRMALKGFMEKRDYPALKNYAMTECSDISSAASVLQSLAGLCMAEAMQGEPDDCMECCAIMRQVVAFIGGELDELEQAAPDVAEEAGEGEYAMMSFNYIKRLHLPHEEQYFQDVLAVKSIGQDDIQGYLALWGNPDLTDAESEFFTAPAAKSGATDFWDGQIAWPRPLTWEHGLDRNWAGKVVVGSMMEFQDDELGRIYRATLNRNTKYRALVDRVVSERTVGTSSDSASQYVQRVPVKGGAVWLKQWPLWAASLTATPCEPRMLDTVHFKTLGISLPSLQNADTPSDMACELPEDLRREAQLFIVRNR